MNCSSQNVWTVADPNHDYSDFLKIPCVSRTKCVAPRNISQDTILQINDDDEETVQYSCQEEHLLNFDSLKYPNSVIATCKQNQVFENTLPFWDFEGVKFSFVTNQSLCLSSSVCYGNLPSLPQHLIRKVTKCNIHYFRIFFQYLVR